MIGGKRHDDSILVVEPITEKQFLSDSRKTSLVSARFNTPNGGCQLRKDNATCILLCHPSPDCETTKIRFPSFVSCNKTMATNGTGAIMYRYGRNDTSQVVNEQRLPTEQRQRRHRKRSPSSSSSSSYSTMWRVVATVVAATAATAGTVAVVFVVPTTNALSIPNQKPMSMKMVVNNDDRSGGTTLPTGRGRQLGVMGSLGDDNSDDSLTTISSTTTTTTCGFIGHKQQKSSNVPVGSPLSMICDDQHEFELQVGRAMDTLRSDYPSILTDNPDYSIYDDNLQLIDPSGVQLHGVKNYKAAFNLIHVLVGIFYCPEQSDMTFRMCFDKARQNIRIHWNAQVIPKALLGGYKSTLHVDGISVYELSRQSGNITQHRIERLIINDMSIEPENGVFAALRGHAVKKKVDSIPIFNNGPSSIIRRSSSSSSSSTIPLRPGDNAIVPFQAFFINDNGRSSLFSESDEPVNKNDNNHRTLTKLSAMSSTGNTFDGNNIDADMEEALNKKNKIRKKFGLAPLTPEEFLDLQEQVAELDKQQQQRAAATAAATNQKNKKSQKDDGNFLKKLFGNVLEDTCESNFDCQRPEVCCDFGIKKMCCSSGLPVVNGLPQSRYGQYAEIPVIANPGPRPYPPYPPNGGGGNNDGPIGFPY